MSDLSKSLQDQVVEIDELVRDAMDNLTQVRFALDTLEKRVEAATPSAERHRAERLT